MTFLEKVESFIDAAESEGIPRWNVAPPAYRILWWLGVKIPPPAFLKGIQAALIEGVFFASLFGLVFFQVFSPRESLAFALGTGVMYGLVGWIQCVDIRRQLDALPEWKQYMPGITYY